MILKITRSTFILLLILISIFGCKKKSNEEPDLGEPCVTTYSMRFGESPNADAISVNYDRYGRMESLNQEDFNLSFSYATDHVDVFSSGIPLYKIDLRDNLAIKITDLQVSAVHHLSYNANRQLIAIESFSDEKLANTRTLTYSNGNLVTLTQIFADNPEGSRTTTFNYSTELADRVTNETRTLFYGVFDSSIPSSVLGATSRYVLTSSDYVNISGNFRSEITRTYTYSRDANGMPTKIVEDSHTVTISNGQQTQDERLKRSLDISSTCN